MTSEAEFEEFAVWARPRLRRALAGHMHRDDVADAVSEALAHGWQHRDRVLTMEHPVGYLFRVGQSKNRRRRQGFLPWNGDEVIPEIEPGLAPALANLSPMQATAVWLVHACGWSHVEVAEALDISSSTVATHTSRGLAALRDLLGVTANG
jgi:DNA-directed RNA polymerase specialized sigma24 family protein